MAKILDKFFNRIIEGKLELSDEENQAIEEKIIDDSLPNQDIEVKSLDASGLITGSNIVEKMNGYSWTPLSNEHYDVEEIYVSVSKTGNKLTLVFFYNITLTGTQQISIDLGNFAVPEDIMDKLYPYTISGSARALLDEKKVQMFSSLTSSVDVNMLLQKQTNDLLIVLYPLANLVSNTKYTGRYEITLLLNDSLAE